MAISLSIIRRRLLATLRWGIKAVAIVLGVAVALVLLLLSSLDAPPVRRLAVRELNSVLSSQFKGKVVVTRLGHLSIFGAAGVDAEVTAASGQRVLLVRGAAVRISPVAVAKGALLGEGDRRIRIDDVSIDAVEASVDAGEDGSLLLVGAFDPATPSPPPSPGARGIAIDLPRARLRHAWVHGVVGGAVPLDVDVDDTRAAFLSATNLTKLDVTKLGFVARGLPMGIEPRAAVEAHLAMPAPSGSAMAARGSLSGSVGRILVAAEVKMDGDNLDGVLDVPLVSSADVRSSIKDAPVFQSVSAHAEAHGALEDLATTAHAQLGEGQVDLEGRVHAKGQLGGTVTLAAHHIDARTFAADGPATDLDARMLAVAAAVEKGLSGHASLTVSGTAAGQQVPRTMAQIEATQMLGEKSAAPTIAAHAEVFVAEPGAPLALTADARSRAGATDVTFGARASVPKLEDVTRLGRTGTGSGELTLAGEAHLAKGLTFQADLGASGQSIHAKGLKADAFKVFVRASGSPTSPVIDARLVATGLLAGGYAITQAQVDADGSPSRLGIVASAYGPKIPDVKLATDVGISPSLGLRKTALHLSRGREVLDLTVDSVRIANGGVDARGVTGLGSAGALQASFRSAPGALEVHAESAGLDLGKLAYLAFQDQKVGGVLAFGVDVAAQSDHAKGKVVLDLTKGTASGIRDGEAHVGLALDGRHLTGSIRGLLGDAGTVELSDIDVHIGGGGAIDARSWRSAWGKLGVKADVDVARVAAMIPPDMLNVTDASGRITLDGLVQRDSLADTTPDVRLAIATHGLRASGLSVTPVREPGGPLMVGPATWTLEGVDFRGDVIVDGTDATSDVALRVVDPKGALLSLDLKTAPLPFAAVLTGAGDLTALLEELPISARADMQKRELGGLPLRIRPDGVRGLASARLVASGTALKPEVELTVQGNALRVAGVPDTPMDGELTVRYDGALATVAAAVRSRADRLLDATAEVHANAKEILGGAHEAWTGSAKAVLASFPLGAVSVLSEDRVKGLVSGEVTVTGLHEHAHAEGNLTFDQLRMGKARFTSGKVAVTAGDEGLDANLRLDGSESSLEASARMGLRWGSEVVPTPDGTGLKAHLLAKHFPASAAEPFTGGAVNDLAGWLDANADVTLVPNRKPEMSGTVALSAGSFEAPALGEAFHGVQAGVTLSKEGVVTLDHVEARGLSGRLTASGSARLDGTTLLGANLDLRIQKKEALPLDIQGTNLGSVYGDIAVKATGAAGGALAVAVSVPDLHVDLPEAGFPRSPQGLADAEGVHVGVYRGPDRFVVLSLDGAPPKLVADRNARVAALPLTGGAKPTPPPAPGEAEAAKGKDDGKALDVAVQLGDVQIRRGQQVSINLDGKLTASVGATTRVRGQIRVKSGDLEVQSKSFKIEKGTVSFVGDDPGNPEVNVTAGWTAPDGTRVFADYIGPVKTGKVTLRSEPPRPSSEIVSLILFGTADGSSATPYASKSPSTGTQAGTAVGGLATDGLSKGLDQLTGMDVTAKIDTSDSANPRPEVEVQLTKNISLEIAVVLGTPPPGTNPDNTYATVDWRFVRNWSLATTFGDEGSTFADVVWQYRY